MTEELSNEEKNAIFNKREREGKVHRMMKKEGDADFVELGKAPVITTKLKGTKEEFRKEAERFIFDNFKGKFVLNKRTGEKIYFNYFSINKLIYEVGSDRLRILFHLKEIIEGATPETVQEITKFNIRLKKDSHFVYNMESMVMVDGAWRRYVFTTFVRLSKSEDKIERAIIYSGHLPIEEDEKKPT